MNNFPSATILHRFANSSKQTVTHIPNISIASPVTNSGKEDRSYMLSFIAISLGRCHRAMRLPDNIGLQPRPVSWQPRVMVLLEGRARALSSSASSSRALAPPSANPLSPSLVPPSLECPRGTGITPRVQRPCSCADATPAWKRRTARSKGTDSSV